MTDAEIQTLKSEYESKLLYTNGFCSVLEGSVRAYVREDALAAPVVSRVKKWESIEKKIKNGGVSIRSVTDLDDLIGIRVIVLFRRNIESTCALIERNLTVIRRKNKSDELQESQFGYQSCHYIVEIAPGYLGEIQVRTAAQHVWAASSHVLQYKTENSPPPELRRALYRVSALLECVDIEIEHVVAGKEAYIAGLSACENTPLNVDSLEQVLDTVWPAQSKDVIGREPHAELLEDIHHFEISDTENLRAILLKHKDAVLAKDKKTASHVGLTRDALHLEFRAPWEKYVKQKRDRGGG